MRVVPRILKTIAVLFVVIIFGGAVWLYASPPELLRVGDGYAAKVVCSNVFIAGRDPDAVLYEDVQAPGNPLLRLVRVAVDREEKRVTARILGLFAPGYAIYRGGFGCTAVPDGNFEAATKSVQNLPVTSVSQSNATWPEGDAAASSNDDGLARLLADKSLIGPAMRAVVVVHNGRIVAEAYGDGFGPKMPLIGWSMTKTVNAAILGRLMLEGKIGFDDARLLPQWKDGEHAAIRLRDLLGMESGLAFDEDYATVADVTRMLYLDADMTALPSGLPVKALPGKRFNYSSGTSTLIAKIWMDRLGSGQAALAYPREALFDPLGMTSAVFEVDARGTFAGSSYLYATAHDWARFGQFLLQGGVWEGRRLLPESFVAAMRAPTKASGGKYTQAQAWLAAPGGDSSAEAGLPEDTFWMEGHDGQSVAIVPSANLVVVRLGLTPSRLGYRPQTLVREVVAALQKQ
ncbi:serine hydrolase [Rhizobium sp. Root1220]|uniref:serine hydrolase domain-containing protein n=1 Tax=Rhizobium sp. Root1220 TaxID=1736432 RepID=UPI0006F2A40D|nr:serine hydrolase [Rhizobium sp. Root1220]KQV82852.1 6-aminohexanoate hydrolase [Rhizobium sp. Root1220]